MPNSEGIGTNVSDSYVKGIKKLGLGDYHKERYIDLREDPAFAWRVLERFPYSQWWRLIHSNHTRTRLAQDLYEAIENIGEKP